MNIFKKPYWSPYIAGILIGSLQIPIFLLLHASLGSSLPFHSIACTIKSWFTHVDTQQIKTSCFPMLKHWWQLGLVLGIFLGAYISSSLAKTRRHGFSRVWTKAASISTLSRRSLMAFCGGFIMLLGARLADGCTSGNGISGIALLSVGSMIVITSMFIGGILVSKFYKKI